MSEADDISQGPKPRRSKLAILSLVVPVVMAVFALENYTTTGHSQPLPYPPEDATCIWLVALFISGLAVGIASLVRIHKSRGRLTGSTLAMSGIILTGLLACVLVCGYWCGYRKDVRSHTPTYLAKLHTLGVALEMYAAANDNRYPPPDKWCDLLLRPVPYIRTDAALFVYLPTGERCCIYALNPDCKADSPPDAVLLFETKGGWNQAGGPEILTTDNHGGKGCNILFNDGSVKFIPSDQLNRLKWK